MDIAAGGTTVIVPDCCKLPKTKIGIGEEYDLVTVFLEYSGLEAYEGQEQTQKPIWMIRAKAPRSGMDGVAEAKFCPFCGKPLPEIIPRPPEEKPAKICHITDGGYYCDTCGERLRACQCHSAVFHWKPAPI